MKTLSLLALLAGALLVSAPASAGERARVRLDVEHAPEMPACPDEHSTRDAIAERLGYDAFDQAAERTVSVSFSMAKDGIVATIRQRETHDGQVFSRELRTGTRICSEAARVLALTLALAIDPVAATSAEPVTPSTSPIAPPVSRPVPEERSPPPPSPPSEHTLAFGAGASLLFGALPQAAPAVDLIANLDRRRFGLEATVDASLAGEARDPAGRGVRASLLGGSLGACLLHWRLRFCPAAFVGALLGEGLGVNEHRTDATPLVIARVRGAVDVPLASSIVVRPYADIGAPLTRTTLAFGATDVWTAPALTATLGLGLLVRP